MFRKHIFKLIYIAMFLFYSMIVAGQIENNTTAVTGGGYIVVSPVNIILDLGESSYASALVLDEDGNPVEGIELQITPQDKITLEIESNSFITDSSGYIHFSVSGKQVGDTVLIISDGIILSDINIVVKDLINKYALQYFYGKMQLKLINPTDYINYVKIQFHENSDRLLPPVTVKLEGKGMKTLKLTEELEVELRDGWLEISSTEILLGGVWTSKGYLSFNKIDK